MASVTSYNASADIDFLMSHGFCKVWEYIVNSNSVRYEVETDKKCTWKDANCCHMFNDNFPELKEAGFVFNYAEMAENHHLIIKLWKAR